MPKFLPSALLEISAKADVASSVRAYLRAVSNTAVVHGLALIWIELDAGNTFRVAHRSEGFGPFEQLERALGRPLIGVMGHIADDAPSMLAVRERRAIVLPDLNERMIDYVARMPGGGQRAAQLMPRAEELRKGAILPLHMHARPWGFVMLFSEELEEADVAPLAAWAQLLESGLDRRERDEREGPPASDPPPTVQSIDADVGSAILRALVEHRRVSNVLDALASTLLAQLSADVVSIYSHVDGRLSLAAQRTSSSVSDAFGRANLAVRELRPNTLVGRAALEDRVVSGRADEVPELTRQMAADSGFKQLIAAPMRLGGRLLGVVAAARVLDVPFDWRHDALLELASLAVRTAEIAEEELRREWDLRLINELGRLVGTSLDPREILQAGVRYLLRVADVPNVFVLIRDPADASLLRLSATNLPEVQLDSVYVRLTDNAPAAVAVNTRELVVVPDVDESDYATHPAVRRFGHKAVIAVPILADREAVGVVILGETRGSRVFNRTEIERVRAMANQMGAALRNAELFSNLRTSYQTLATAQAQLVEAERLAAIGELSAIMAHEVRNPLASIFNSLATLRRRVLEPSDAVMMLDILEEEAGRLNRIVAALLDFVRPFAPSYRPMDAVDVARNVLAVFAKTLSTKNPVTLRIEATDKLLHVDSDEHLLHQALINLLENAAQAAGASPGGEVTLRVLRDAERLRLEVIDNGPGIPDDLHKSLFEPFFTTKPTGTGLGLPIVKRIAEALRGEVIVESTPGTGTKVSLLVPSEAPNT